MFDFTFVLIIHLQVVLIFWFSPLYYSPVIFRLFLLRVPYLLRALSITLTYFIFCTSALNKPTEVIPYHCLRFFNRDRRCFRGLLFTFNLALFYELRYLVILASHDVPKVHLASNVHLVWSLTLKLFGHLYLEFSGCMYLL